MEEKMKQINFWKSTVKPIKKKIGLFNNNKISFKPIIINTRKNVRNIPKSKMTWSQAQIKYPRMSPFKDSDRDGKLNMFDCKPFNKKKDGFKHQYSFSTTDNTVRTVQMSPKKFLRETHKESLERDRRSGRKDVPQSYEEYERQVIHEETPESKKKLREMGKAIKSKEKNLPVPFLEYDEEGTPKGHEGRHTAKAAEEEGIETIPVNVVRRKKGRYDEEAPEEEDKPTRRSLSYQHHTEKFEREYNKEEKEKPEVLSRLDKKEKLSQDKRWRRGTTAEEIENQEELEKED
jgi:hypothetical protein